MPRHQNQVNFNNYTKTKSISPHTQKPSTFWSLHWNKAMFDPPHTLSHVWSQHQTQVIFDPRTKQSQFRSPLKNKSISIPIRNQFIFNLEDSKQAIFDHLTETKSIPIPTLTSSHVRSSSMKSSQFRPPTQTRFNTHTKTKLVSASIQKPSSIRSPA